MHEGDHKHGEGHVHGKEKEEADEEANQE